MENNSINNVETTRSKQLTTKVLSAAENVFSGSKEDTQNVEEVKQKETQSPEFTFMFENENGQFPLERKRDIKHKDKVIGNTDSKEENTSQFISEHNILSTDPSKLCNQFQDIKFKRTFKNDKSENLAIDAEQFSNHESQKEQDAAFKVDVIEDCNSVSESNYAKHTQQKGKSGKVISERISGNMGNIKRSSTNSNEIHQTDDSKNDNAYINKHLNFKFSGQCNSNHENQVFVFGKSERKPLLPNPTWCVAKSKANQTMASEKKHISRNKEKGNEKQNFTLPFITSNMDKTLTNGTHSNTFVEQVVKKASSFSSLPDVNDTNKIIQRQEHINTVQSNNDENKIPDLTSLIVNMTCSTGTDRKCNTDLQPISPPIQRKNNDSDGSMSKNNFERTKRETEIACHVPQHNPDKTKEYILKESSSNFGNSWKQMILKTRDKISDHDSRKNAENLSENLTLKRQRESEEKWKTFEKNFFENQCPLLLSMVQEHVVPKTASKNKSDSFFMARSKHMYSSDEDNKYKCSHSVIQKENQFTGTSPQWSCGCNEYNQNLNSSEKKEPGIISPLSNKTSKIFNFLRNSDDKNSSIFQTVATNNENLYCSEIESSTNMASNKTFSSKESFKSLDPEIVNILKKDNETMSVKKWNVGIPSSSVDQHKQIVRGQVAFSCSSANDNRAGRFSDGKGCNNEGHPLKDMFSKASYSKNRLRINFSDSTEDESSDKTIDYQKKMESPRETLLRTGYFLKVRKTKHFRLPTKLEKPSHAKVLHLYNAPASNSQEMKEYCLRNHSGAHSFAEKASIEKFNLRKGITALKMKLTSSEIKRDEFAQEASFTNNQNSEVIRKNQKGILPKMKERLFVDTDIQDEGGTENLTFSMTNCPAKISITDSGNLKLESNNPDIEQIYWVRNSNSCLNEDALGSSFPCRSVDDENYHFHESTDNEDEYFVSNSDSCSKDEDVFSSSIPGGSSDDENFHFHDSTEVSSASGRTSGDHSKSGSPERMISYSPYCDISESYQMKSESNLSATSIVENTEKGTGIWNNSLDDEREIVREFASNAEQNTNGKVFSSRNTIRNKMDLRNSKTKVYHLKHGNMNLRFCDDPSNHVTLRIISENEGHPTDSYSKRNSEHSLTMKELKPQYLERERSYSFLNSDDDASEDVVSTADEGLVSNIKDNADKATTSHIRKNTTIDTETLKFDFRPEKGITEVKFRRMFDVTYLQYRSEKTKLYFKKKYF